MTERYAGENFEVHELVAWYRRAVEAATLPEAEAHPWHYGRWADGTPIPRAARLLWRARVDLRRAFPAPFDPAGLLHWIATQEPAILGRGPAG
jgi:hypothetical protein